jgi:hypothetical protein
MNKWCHGFVTWWDWNVQTSGQCKKWIKFKLCVIMNA